MPAAAEATATEREREPAQPTQPRIVVRPFTGAQAGKIRGAAVRGLRSEPIELFPNKQFVAEARSLGAKLDGDGGHIAPASALAVSGLLPATESLFLAIGARLALSVAEILAAAITYLPFDRPNAREKP